MAPSFAGWNARTLDLATERCTQGLDPERTHTLRQLAADDELAQFESAVAAVHLASLTRVEAPPPALRERLEEQALEAFGLGTQGPTASRPALNTSHLLALAGWAIAASLLLGFLLVSPGDAVSPSGRRTTLVAMARDLVQVPWTSTDDPAAQDATGDVVWSTERQEGYMRFRNLVPNVPQDSRYQLWIFDPTRPDWEEHPVDGGLFDVADGGDTVVPMAPKLKIGEPVLFAVTIERPNGVVVSKRERLVLTAAL